ncbi:MAG: aldehyde dehydrogenase family protein [Candidatus Omnitrophota bacterium]|nr:aldehyde dehydrogenase family protein [Candidatus Omnitrophota bacterium]
MIPHYSLLINNDFKDSGVKQDIINPCTGEAIATVSVADKKEIELAINSARKAFDSGQWRNISLAERKDFIMEISGGILAKAGELANLESLNVGKPIKESTFMDIPSAAATFEYFANNLEKYLNQESIEIKSQIAKAQSNLIRQPQGVVVLIVPWNYPLLIASWKMAQALASGNTVILKPSSLTPLTALELGRIVSEAGLPKGVVNIITGRGDTIGQQLCSDKRVDMISFTGSNGVGKKIIEYTSKNVKKLIMELGGKSAGIILADADLELAVNGSLCSIFLNQGQMCTAMSRIFVEDDIYDNFINDFVAKAQRIKLGLAMDFETQMGPLISKEQRDRVISFVEKAIKEGAKLLCGGKASNEPALKNGFFFEPTVFVQTSPQMAIFKEEVFGPVVCIHKFSTLEEAVNLANNSDFALAASIWTKDVAVAQKLAKDIDAGTIWINTYGMFFNELPYGGFKQSGFGKELGKEGFFEYTRLKNVIVDQTKEAKPLVNYWYGL